MKSCKWMLVLVLGAALCGACGGGDDDSGSAASGSGGASGASGASDSGSGGSGEAGSAGGAAQLPEGAVGCGADMCVPPDNSTATACCADPFANPPKCGTMAGQTCTPLPKVDDRCPSVMSPMGTIFLPSCCTDDGQCGIDGSVFGYPGCTENSEAKMMAEQMTGGMFTMFITFPDSQSCD